MLDSRLGLFSSTNGESLLEYILKTSGHVCIQIVNLSAPHHLIQITGQ